MYGWQQWSGNRPGISQGNPAYGTGPNNGMPGGWIHGQQQPNMMPPPNSFAQMGTAGFGLMAQNPVHCGWQHQMPPNNGFGMGQGYRAGGMMMMNPSYRAGVPPPHIVGPQPPTPVPPLPQPPLPLPAAAETTPAPSKPPLPPQQQDEPLTSKEAAEKEKLEQLKQQAQQWQQQMASVQQQQFMGGESQFPVSAPQQPPFSSLPVPQFQETVATSQQMPVASQNRSAPMEMSRQLLAGDSSQPVGTHFEQNEQQIDSFSIGDNGNRAANNNNNKPTVEPLMSQRLLTVPPACGGGQRFANEANTMVGEFFSVLRQEQMSFVPRGNRVFQDESLEEEFRFFRQRNRFQDYDRGFARGGQLNDNEPFRRPILQDPVNVMQSNRSGMMQQRPLLGQRPYDDQNQMLRAGPLLGQRPSGDFNEMRRGGPLSGQKSDEANVTQRRGPLLGQSPFVDPSAMQRSEPLLGRRPFEDLGPTAPRNPLLGQAPLDDPMTIGAPQDRPLLGEQPVRAMINAVEAPTVSIGQPPTPQGGNAACTVGAAVQEARRELSRPSAASQPSGSVHDKVMEEFTSKLASWNQQFETWKEQNKDHPDREAYYVYEKQWQQWKDKLLERHEQMKRLQIEGNRSQSSDTTLTVEGVPQHQDRIQQQPGVRATDVTANQKDVGTTQPQIPSQPASTAPSGVPTPLELAAKLLVGMAGPLLKNATSILSANKDAALNFGRIDTAGRVSETNRESKTSNDGATKAAVVVSNNYSPSTDQPIDMVLDSDNEVNFAEDSYDPFDPAPLISEETNADSGRESDVTFPPNDPGGRQSADILASGLVHPGPWKPLPSSILSGDRDARSDLSKLEPAASFVSSAGGSKSGREFHGACEGVREAPKDTERSVTEAPFDIREMLMNDDKEPPQRSFKGWCLMIPNPRTESDNMSNFRGSGRRRRRWGQEQGRNFDTHFDSDRSQNPSRFEEDRPYEGLRQQHPADADLFFRRPLLGSPMSQNRTEMDYSIPFCERTDVWDNPYLCDEDYDGARYTDQGIAEAEIGQMEHDSRRSMHPLLPNPGFHEQIRDDDRDPTGYSVTSADLCGEGNRRLRRRRGQTRFSGPLPNPEEMFESDNDPRFGGIPRDTREYVRTSRIPEQEQRPSPSPDISRRHIHGGSRFDDRFNSRQNQQSNEPTWYDRPRNNDEFPPEQDMIRTAAEELRTLQDRMEDSLAAPPPPDVFTLDIHQIRMKPRTPAVVQDEIVEVGRKDNRLSSMERTSSQILDASKPDGIQRLRDGRSRGEEEEEERDLSPRMAAVSPLESRRFWERRSASLVGHEQQTDRDRDYSSLGPSSVDQGGEGASVPISIDYGHGVANPLSVGNLAPGQDVFDYFEKMFSADKVQTIDYGHGKKDLSPYEKDYGRNRLGRERDRSYDRSSRWERSPDRLGGRIRDRSHDRNRDRDKLYDTSRDGDRGRERERHCERKSDVERSYNRGHTRERSRDRSRERDTRSGYVPRDVDRDRSRRDDFREKVYKDFPARDCHGWNPDNKVESVLIEDLLGIEGRKRRPHSIVIILRGPPGSGKTFVAKLIKDKEIENGGSAPRMLCLDDYFMVETEQAEVDVETGKNVNTKVLKYEYEPEMEDSYRNSLFKSFKKTIEDGFFPFIIVDAINNRIRHFEEILNFAKHKGFQVYVAEMDMDAAACHKRNIHSRTLDDTTKIIDAWESTPRHYLRVDVRSLLQDAAITEVEMEDLAAAGTDSEHKEDEEQQLSNSEVAEEPDGCQKKRKANDEEEVVVSKWEKLEATGEKLAKLDGLGLMSKRKKDSVPQSLESYLQLPDDYEQRECLPGQKRVRWADVEERKEQEKKRALGFVVGQTDWQTMTDPSHAEKALNQTKYI